MPNTLEYTIELDCAPGYPRPNDLLPSILEGTGVEIDPENTVMRFFGWWSWIVPANQHQQYEIARDLVKQRITDLYNRGVIRAGSW